MTHAFHLLRGPVADHLRRMPPAPRLRLRTPARPRVPSWLGCPVSRTRVVGYVRVSTGQQVDDGVSLDAQRARLEAYATALDLELVAVVEDAGLSAKSLDRPGLTQALAMLDSGQADGLLITKLDRLTRDVRDLGTLLAEYFGRFALLSVSDSIDTRTAVGRLMLNILTSVTQWEREAISERTKAALDYLKTQGVKLGRPLRASPEQVERVRQLRAEGRSMRAIAAALSTPERTWSAAAVSRVLGAAC